jgi:hypothetical protein
MSHRGRALEWEIPWLTKNRLRKLDFLKLRLGIPTGRERLTSRFPCEVEVNFLDSGTYRLRESWCLGKIVGNWHPEELVIQIESY